MGDWAAWIWVQDQGDLLLKVVFLNYPQAKDLWLSMNDSEQSTYDCSELFFFCFNRVFLS